jgi:hypothetical protein
MLGQSRLRSQLLELLFDSLDAIFDLTDLKGHLR